jgi:proline dehydrogenase
VGQDVSAEFCLRQLERIVDALPAGRGLDVGAEDSGRIDASHQILITLAGRGAPVQATLQANLRRSTQDWPRLVEAGLGIRLVKGAYVEPERVAHRYGPATEEAYRRLARSLRAAGARVTLATHDAALREGLLAELGPMDVEMLLGVRPEDHGPLLARGVTPRLYVPYGRDWFRYWAAGGGVAGRRLSRHAGSATRRRRTGPNGPRWSQKTRPWCEVQMAVLIGDRWVASRQACFMART